MPDTEKITLIRNSMPVTRDKVYLNTGAVGPLSTINSEVLQQSQARELAEGRGTMSGYKALIEAQASLRQAIARLVKATPQEIALTHHTTDGMNIVAHGLNWQPGDEIITTDWEHPGGFLPLYVLRQRQGVELKVVKLAPNDSPEEVVAKFGAAITPRTRLMVFSHVAWNTGMRLPLPEIVAMGHRHNVLSLVDGLNPPGQFRWTCLLVGLTFMLCPARSGCADRREPGRCTSGRID